MTNRWHRAFRPLAGSCALATVCFVLTGCADTPNQSQQKQPKVTVKIEACPADSPEQTRFHKIDEFGREFEVEIVYRDKTKGWEIYNPNTGVLVEFKRTHVDHKVLRQHAKYTLGELVWEELYHTNGKALQRREWLRNGDRKLVQYAADGSAESLTLILRADGSGEWIQMNRDWSSNAVNGIRQKQVWKTNGDTVREVYDYQDGKTLLTRATSTGDKLVVDGYRPDGVVQFRQFHKSVPGGPNKRSPWQLERVELLSADGKTVQREFHYRSDAPLPCAVHFPVEGGGKRVVECSYDTQRQLHVTGEKVFDPAGKLLSEKTGSTDAKLEELKPHYRWVQPAHDFPRNLKQQVEPWFRRSATIV